MTVGDRLYGTEGAEELHFDPATVWESEIEPNIEDNSGGSVVIEEWTVHPPEYHMPKAADILEWVLEWTYENGEVAEGWDVGQPSVDDPALLAVAEALREAIGAKIKYRMADQLVAKHTITWAPGDYSRPMLDGEPMYGPRKEWCEGCGRTDVPVALSDGQMRCADCDGWD